MIMQLTGTDFVMGLGSPLSLPAGMDQQSSGGQGGLRLLRWRREPACMDGSKRLLPSCCLYLILLVLVLPRR